MSTSSTHLDGWKRGLQDRIHRIPIIHHLVGGPFSLWKLYNIPWSPPIPISSCFTSWLRDFPSKMLYPNESSEPWLPRSMLYSLVFNTWSDHFFGHKNETHGHTRPFGRRFAIFEQSPKLSSNTWKVWPLQPRPTTPSDMHRDSKCQSRPAGVPSIAPSSRSYGVVQSWLWASEGLNHPENESAKTLAFIHVTADMWLPIVTLKGRKHHHADSDVCVSPT